MISFHLTFCAFSYISSTKPWTSGSIQFTFLLFLFVLVHWLWQQIKLRDCKGRSLIQKGFSWQPGGSFCSEKRGNVALTQQYIKVDESTANTHASVMSASVFQQTELYMLIYMHTYCVCVYVYVCMYAYYVAKGIRMSAVTRI